jgi:hypothetical protein
MTQEIIFVVALFDAMSAKQFETIRFVGYGSVLYAITDKKQDALSISSPATETKEDQTLGTGIALDAKGTRTPEHTPATVAESSATS